MFYLDLRFISDDVVIRVYLVRNGLRSPEGQYDNRQQKNPAAEGGVAGAWTGGET